MIYQVKEPPSIQLALAKLYKKTYLFVDLPSMILAVGLGTYLLFFNGVNFRAGWLHMKLTFAFFLIISDIVSGCKIFKLCKMPLTGKAVSFRFLHLLVLLFLLGVLVAIYILKQKYR